MKTFPHTRLCLSTAAAVVAMAACSSNGDAPRAGAAAALPAVTLAAPAGYRLVWADEFDQPGLPDATRWDYDTGRNKEGWYNNERQYYSRARLDNSEVRGGRLVITARREAMTQAADWGGQPYSSARLLTRGKAAWTYGFFEVRAKMPCGRGTWPAIWMLGEGVWPAAGELDILEHVGSEPARVFSTVHTASGSGGKGVGAGSQLDTACSAFHNYQMWWTPESLSFGVDGRVHHVYENKKTGTAQWPFDAPQFLILNVAIGGDLGGPVDDAVLPVSLEIEHVRVWQK